MGRSGALAVVIAVMMAAPTVAGDGATLAFAGLERLAITVAVEHPLEGLAPDELERRLTAFVAALTPPVAVGGAGPDRLRLTVTVRPRSSAELRGFYLPFSATYGIGTVRLALERAVQLPGPPAPTIRAIVWQRERTIATRWPTAGTAVVEALDMLLDELREATLERR